MAAEERAASASERRPPCADLPVAMAEGPAAWMEERAVNEERPDPNAGRLSLTWRDDWLPSGVTWRGSEGEPIPYREQIRWRGSRTTRDQLADGIHGWARGSTSSTWEGRGAGVA